MKLLSILVLSLVSLSASAYPSRDSEKARAWIRDQLDNNDRLEFLGQTPEGRSCKFYLIDKDLGQMYVSVGYNESNDRNDYIGAANTNSEIVFDGPVLSLRSDLAWQNSSHYNTVTVLLDNKAVPERAIGVSDLKAIECLLNPSQTEFKNN